MGPRAPKQEIRPTATHMQKQSQPPSDLYDGLHAVSLVVDKAGRIVHANPAVEGLIGFKADALIGSDFCSTLISAALADSDRAALAAALAGGRPICRQSAWNAPDGSEQLVVWSFSPLALDEFGPGAGVITALPVSNLAIEESENRLQAIFETAVEGIISINERGIIEAVNPAAQKLFGYRAVEIIGKNISMLMPSPFSEEHDEYLADYLKSGVARIIGIGREAQARCKDGKILPVNLAVSEVRLGGRILFTGFITDLSERKEHERQAEQWRQELERRVELRTAELARANEELEHFATTISHDLRSPVRGIQHYVEFLIEDLGEKLEGESKRDLKALAKEARELDRMIEELLQYSRIGRRHEEAEPIDTRSMIQEIAERAAADRDAEVVVEGDLPELVVPFTLLRQIFQNLIENGLRYNQSDTRRVRVTASQTSTAPARWRFEVSDNGIGIAASQHEKIFAMFQRLHRDDEYSGTGVGLAAVRKAVILLGGEVRLKSAPGEGSTFYVELPEAPPPCSAFPEVSSTSSSSG